MCASPRKSAVPGGTSLLRNAAGLMAGGLLMGSAAIMIVRQAGELLLPAEASAAAASTPAAGAPAAKSTAPAKPAPKPAVTPVRTSPGASAAVAPVKLNTPAPAKKPVGSLHPIAQLDDQVTYQYNALGRRDPFNPMIGGQFVGDDQGGDAPVDVGGMKVVGIVWGTSDKFALVEDARGASLVLRAGDKVMNGVVDELKRDAVVVKLTVDGQTQSVAIPLTRKGDQNANR